MPECYIRGSTIKYLRIPDEVIDMVKEEVIQKAKGRGDFKARGGGNQRGRGRGNKTMDVWFLLNVFCLHLFTSIGLNHLHKIADFTESQSLTFCSLEYSIRYRQLLSFTEISVPLTSAMCKSVIKCPLPANSKAVSPITVNKPQYSMCDKIDQ